MNQRCLLCRRSVRTVLRETLSVDEGCAQPFELENTSRRGKSKPGSPCIKYLRAVTFAPLHQRLYNACKHVTHQRVFDGSTVTTGFIPERMQSHQVSALRMDQEKFTKF